jgi:hypothetical protein
LDGVEDFDSLIAWAKERVAVFRNCVLDIAAARAADERARDVLLKWADDLEALIDLWPDFDKEFGR